MSTNEPNASPSSNNVVNTGKKIVDRLSLAGKLMCGATILAILSAFLSLFTVSVNVENPVMKMAAVHNSGSSMVIQDWRGVVAVLCCVGCGVMTWMLLSGTAPAQARNFTIAMLAAGGVALLMCILIWVDINRASSAFTGLGAEMRAGAGIGAYLILLASLVCLAGSVLHARDKNLF
ncbi:MAG: hypothetical protein JNJ77_02670 [Planctomycetia bacterium]|nr:hypothetical protein [Planctomycetia bacterium]